MSISSDLIKEFVKITNDSTQPTNTESTVYGTVVESNGTKYVRLDGSDQLTPVTTTIDISDGERVTVLIKNHTATITGNITSPAAKQVVVQNVNDKLDVAYGRIGELSADNLTISQQLNAASADIEKLEADVANIGSVTVEYLEANYTKTYDLKATYATIEELTAVNAKIDNLDVGDLTADFVKTEELEAKVAALGYATVTDLNAATARIDVLETNQLTIGQLDGKYATIVNLDAAVGRIRTLESTQITTDYLSANYATISALNATELKVTNYVDSVEINGNRITAGTLTVDRLIVRGSTESIVYELNNITGALQSTQVDTLNGEIITPRTINADKIIAGSITTTELNVDKIFGNTAVINKIVAQDAFINAISTNSIVVGASNNASAALAELSNVSSIKYAETNYNVNFAQIKVWAREGYSGSWGVTSTADYRIGDTIYLIVTNSTTGGYVYIITTVTAINSSTSFRGTSHGFIDPSATDAAATAQSTANSASTTANSALLATEVSSINDTTKTFKNVCAYTAKSGNISGYLVITTPIKPNRMTRMHISGYNYTGGSETLDLTVGFHLYGSAPYFYNAGYINNGSLGIKSVQVATVSSTDFSPVIIIETTNQYWQYPQIVVNEVTVSYAASPDTYKDGFSATITSTLSSDYANVTTVVGTDLKALSVANNSVIAAWCYNNNTTWINGANIYTGTITADKIDVNDLFAQDITATGTITGVTLNGVEIKGADILLTETDSDNLNVANLRIVSARTGRYADYHSFGITFYDEEDSEMLIIQGSGYIEATDIYTDTLIVGGDVSAPNLMLKIYPIGAIYISTSSTNPGTLFGGTWEQIKDRFLMACGSYASGYTGGSATHTHTLSAGWAKIQHNDGYFWFKEKNVTSWVDSGKAAASGKTTSTNNAQGIELGGNTDSGSNMPPFLAVYVWKRTA